MLIEMMGASGAGKSTILDRAIGLRAASVPEWVSPAEAERWFQSVPAFARRRALDDPEAATLMETVFGAVTASSMRPSQVVTALAMLPAAEFMRQAIQGAGHERPVVYDEGPLNRSYSTLLNSDDVESHALEYFRAAPMTSCAVLVSLGHDQLLQRVLNRRRAVNVYRGLDQGEIAELARRASLVTDIAADVLGDRGLPVLRLHGEDSATSNATRLHQWVGEQAGTDRNAPIDSLREQILEASRTFQMASSRHARQRQEVAYCSFHTRRFSVLRPGAQRDSVRRFKRFGLTRRSAQGRSALDLGCFTGGMLLELSNLGIRRGLGIEHDVDKAAIAQRIASRSGLDQLEFRQGDVDTLEPTDVGTHEIVLCLAIEAHVKDPDRLYWLLGQVTSGRLYFEGNGGCDVPEVITQLRAAGFRRIRELGISDDDIEPRNHNRPLLVADH